MTFPMVRKLLPFLGLLLVFSLSAKDIPQRPRPAKLVNDFAGILSPAEAARLEKKLTAFDDSTSNQIAIVIEKSLEGDDLFDYSYRLASEWGIGNENRDNGVLIFVASDDRKLFIHTGPGLQDRLPDAIAKRIIETVIKPAFKNGQFYQGLDKGSSTIVDITSGTFKGLPNNQGEELPPEAIFIILLFIILFIYLNSRNDGGGYRGGGRYDHTGRGGRGGGWIIIGGPGGFGGGGSSGGGGGFGGFGGGGFDGGGAGGSW